MLLAAEFGTGQVFGSMLWFFLFFIWIIILFQVFGDIFRSKDLGGWAKAIWSIFIIFLPFIGIFIYLIARGGGMGERQVAAAQKQNEQMQEYIRSTTGSAGGSSDAEQLTKLADLHASGKLDDAEYASAKAKVIGS